MYIVNGKECFLNYVTDSTRYADKNPTYLPALEAVKEFNKFVASVGHVRNKKGTGPGWGRVVAKVDPRILEIALEIEPDLLMDDKKWERWLAAHPECKIK